MDNITKVHFNPDEDYIWDIKGLVQWDKCQKLEISGLDISDEIVEVHFSLDEVQGNAERMYGTVKDGVIHADIPEFILESPEYICSGSEVYNAYAWVYVSDEESAETIRKMEFEIKARPKPNGYASPDKQDPFLQEIRQVMNETKDIAQSVRDDADNGVFNGEQGPKGDAGSIEFKIVNELPTENINESAMYLVPLSPGSEQNEFAEYIYVNGHWEYIGSASVEVDLSEYVKNTDYASNDNFGVVKTNSKYGIQTDNGVLFIKRATDGEINLREQQWAVITPKNLDYAVKKALSDCKLSGDDAWTKEEKLSATTLLNALSLYNLGTGMRIDSVGKLMVDGSIVTEEMIKGKTYHNVAITPKTVDLAVKYGLTDNKLEWTDEEKAKALELLGGLKKSTDKSTFHQVYGKSANGEEQWLTDFSKGADAQTLAQRDVGGTLQVGTPTNDKHATTKKYVDDLVGGIETLLGGI